MLSYLTLITSSYGGEGGFELVRLRVGWDGPGKGPPKTGVPWATLSCYVRPDKYLKYSYEENNYPPADRLAPTKGYNRRVNNSALRSKECIQNQTYNSTHRKNA